MKKVGLAVCYDTKNFGSQLQVLATIKKVEECNCTAEIIRYNKKLTPAFIAQTIPRLFNVSFVKSKLSGNEKDKKLKNHPAIAEKVKQRSNRFNGFVKEYFAPYFSVPYNGWEMLVKKCAENYDAFLCGSDQLWLPNNLGSHFYTLEFAPDNKPKIAYATSFGVSRIPGFQERNTAKYLNRFQALSTREISGQKIIKDLTGKDAQVVCDPTLLFDAAGWAEIIPSKKVIEEPYVFCYFLGTNEAHREIGEEFREKTGLKLVSCPFLDHYAQRDLTFGDIQIYDMDSKDFVNLIRHAQYILTDSFHGSVFSILHHKKFMTFNRFSDGFNSRNSRIDSLCTLLELSERRYSGNIMDVEKDIDYAAVEEKLSRLRTESIQYLETALR
ncbi:MULTISPECIES: polysaccharide pyruvyl transferase family protein [unclassified Blautia]|uniref:polysaccharide pyruvyl transferase family protein n=1 Tax=unclassified Blautia TaxID=2648079 RepID=UPI003F8C9EAC